MQPSRFATLLRLVCAAVALALGADSLAAAATAPFEIVIDTTQSGVPGDTTFTLPLNPAETYDFTVDWGDSSTAAITTSSDQTHTYAVAGVHTISITENVVGGFPTYQNGTGTTNYLNGLKLMQIAAWGGNTWSTFAYSFYDCTNLTISATDAATAKTGAVTDFSGAWTGCSSMTSFPLLDTHAGTDFGEAWDECSGLTSFPLLNTAAGVSFADTWNGCSGLSSFPNLNMANGQVFFEAWAGCTGLTAFPSITLTNITDGRGAFAGDTLATADYSNLLISLAANAQFGGFTFNGGNSRYDLAAASARNTTLIAGRNWTITDGGEQTPFTILIDTTKSGASGNNQFILPLNPAESYDFTVDWGDSSTSAVTTNSDQTHTYASTGVYTIQIGENVVGGFPTIQFGNGSGDQDKLMQISAWGGNTWTTLNNSFAHCRNLTITATDATGALTGNVTDFSQAWLDCEGMTVFPAIDSHSGTDFSSAWSSCVSLTGFPLIDTSHGTNFQSTWSGCWGLTSFPLLVTSTGTNFADAWWSCTRLTSFPLLDTSHGTSFNGTWQACIALTSFPMLDTGAGTDFSYAWSDCAGLTSFPPLDTSHGTDFTYTWELCTALTAFPLINTGNGVSFNTTWYNCSALATFPQLDTGNGQNFINAWANCSALTSFPLINTGNAAMYFGRAWSGCTSLTSFPLLDSSHVTDFSYAWSGCTGLTSFPLLNTASGQDFDYAWAGCTALTAFPILDLSQMAYGNSAFSGDTLNADDYSNLLIAIAANNTHTAVTFDGGNSQYLPSSITARNTTLIAGRGWTITDGGEQPPTITSATTAAVTVGNALTYQIIATNSPTSYGAVNLPAGLSVDATTGAITGTPTAVAVTTVTLSATNGGGTATANLAITVLPLPPVITSATTATAVVGSAFTYQITATNTPTGYAADNLPAGLTISATDGAITGIPTGATAAAVAITATNASGTGAATLTITVLPLPPVITSPTFATASSGQYFVYHITANNAPTSFSAANLPAGLTVDVGTGAITGTPTSSTAAMVTLGATNAGGTGTALLTLVVLPPSPLITSPNTASVTVGEAFTYQITATNAPTSFSASGLPDGLSVDTVTGAITGVPTTVTTAVVTVTASNQGGTNIATLTITVLPVPPVITSATAAGFALGVPFSYQITASNDPTSFSAGNLPTGLSVNATTGAITGIPTSNCSEFSVTATNDGGTGYGDVELISPPVIISGNITATVGDAFTYRIATSDGATAYTATGLPPGLSLDATTGAITGVPTGATVASVVVTATNLGGTGTATITLTVQVLPPLITSATETTATVGSAFTYQITAINDPTTFSAAPLPPGLSIDGAGLISGTPTNATVAVITVGAANAAGSATASLTFTIAPEMLSITWATPLPITYLTPLSSTQLDANASVAGTFAYRPVAGAVLNAGTQILSATFTPSDPTVATTASATVALIVRQAVPVLTWTPPASITTGTPLTATQLGATASVPGTFAFDPPIGTVLTQGTHTLAVTFTPDDAVDYTTTSATVNLDIVDGSATATATATAGGTTTTAVTSTGGGGGGYGLGSGLALLGLTLIGLRRRRH
jgi:hypothetical protein